MLKRKDKKGRGWGGPRPNQNGAPPKYGEPTIKKTFRIPVSLDNTLKALAEDRGVRQPQLVVEALTEWIAQ